jgi:baculoviral IAP repeat-containing protein 2/3
VQLVKGNSYIKNVLQRIQNTNQITASLPTAPISIDDAMSSQPALDALQMGLNAGRVRVVMQRRLQMTGRPFTSTEALVAAVLDGQIEDEGFEPDPETEGQIESQVTELLLSAVNSVAFSGTNVVQQASTSFETAPSVGLSNVRPIVPENSNTSQLRPTATESLRSADKLPTSNETSTADPDSDERRLKNVECKICMAEEIGVVFLPCGHLLSCVYCAPALTQCPLCRETIRGRVRTFLS